MNEMNNKKYASLKTLEVFLDNLRNVFAEAPHTHTKDEITDFPNIDTKRDVVNVVTSVENPLTLSDNTEYRLTDVSSLTLSYPEGSFECWMKVSFSLTEPINVTFPIETKYIGSHPSFMNGETWEISVKDGVVVCVVVV